MKKVAKVASSGIKDLKDKIIKEVKVGRQGRVEDKLRADSNNVIIAKQNQKRSRHQKVKEIVTGNSEDGHALYAAPISFNTI